MSHCRNAAAVALQLSGDVLFGDPLLAGNTAKCRPPAAFTGALKARDVNLRSRDPGALGLDPENLGGFCTSLFDVAREIRRRPGSREFIVEWLYGRELKWYEAALSLGVGVLPARYCVLHWRRLMAQRVLLILRELGDSLPQPDKHLIGLDLAVAVEVGPSLKTFDDGGSEYSSLEFTVFVG